MKKDQQLLPITPVSELIALIYELKDRLAAYEAPPGKKTPAAQIRSAWLAAYERTYNRKCVSWGARESKQAQNLLKTWPLDHVLLLVDAFFAWTHPAPLAKGHPFGVGSSSFVMMIHELDADTHSPERRKDVAVFGARMKETREKAVQVWAQGELTAIGGNKP